MTIFLWVLNIDTKNSNEHNRYFYKSNNILKDDYKSHLHKHIVVMIVIVNCQ